MKNFLKMIFSTTAFTPPEKIRVKLMEKFPDIINVEWNKVGSSFEAIFYKDQVEYIAVIDSTGELIEYKMSLSEDLLPQQIKEDLNQKGEIMNAVLNNKGNGISYEVIIRDTQLVRYLINLSESGVVISEKKL